MHLQSLKLLHPTVKEETHLQEIYKMYGRTDACTYKTDVQRFLMLIFPYKFMQLTPEKYPHKPLFNPITPSYPNRNLTKHNPTDCITPLQTRWLPGRTIDQL